TDPVGRSAFNRRLSQARAAAVRDALIARGVPAERLRARGFAARRPIADNTTESGRARNRRIEFHVVRSEERRVGKEGRTTWALIVTYEIRVCMLMRSSVLSVVI